MGHVVNPLIFRFGQKKIPMISWKCGYGGYDNSTYHKNIKEELILRRVLMGIFYRYGLPFYNKKRRRNVRREDGSLFFPGERGILKNPFLMKEMFLSHFHIGRREGGLLLSIFLYDKGLERIRYNIRNNYKLLPSNIIVDDLVNRGKYKYFSEKFGHIGGKIKSIIPQNKLVKKFNKEGKIIGRKWKRVKVVKFKLIKEKRKGSGIMRNKKKFIGGRAPYFTFGFSTRRIGWKPHIYKPFAMTTLLYFRNGNIWRREKKENLLFPLLDMGKIVKLFKFFFSSLRCQKEKKGIMFQIKILQILLKIILMAMRKNPLYKGHNPNPGIFRKKRRIKRKRKEKYKAHKPIPLLLKKLYIILKLKEISLIKMKAFSRGIIWRKRYGMMKNVSKGVAMSIFEMYKRREVVTLHIIGYNSKNITPQLICNYIIQRLAQYLPIQPILNDVINWLKRNKRNHLGYKIVVCGRLTRKERAAYILKSYGSLPLSTKTSPIDYFADAKIMKFGMVGIKVWIHRNPKKNRSGYYFFRFLYKRPKKWEIIYSGEKKVSAAKMKRNKHIYKKDGENTDNKEREEEGT